jgi:hypothetical protein
MLGTEAHKVDRLFLLVGKNPLPNYVVAKSGLLLREGGKPYLVYTTDTKKYAYKLRDKLGLTAQEMISLEDSHADAFVIQTRIREKAEKLSGRLGLNYTGGTKAMAVNAYIVIKLIKRDEKPVFSYLDPYSVKLLIDQNNLPPIPKSINLQLKLPDIFDLHTKEFSLKNCRTVPRLPNLLTFLAKFSLEWNGWRNNNKTVKSLLEDNNSETPIPLNGLPSDIISILKDENLLASSGNELSILRTREKLGSKSLKETKDWLKGTWLEDFVLFQVSKISSECGASFDISLPGKDKKFEFDVAFLKGYQLFAFSCTTSSKEARCKQNF